MCILHRDMHSLFLALSHAIASISIGLSFYKCLVILVRPLKRYPLKSNHAKTVRVSVLSPAKARRGNALKLLGRAPKLNTNHIINL